MKTLVYMTFIVRLFQYLIVRRICGDNTVIELAANHHKKSNLSPHTTKRAMAYMRHLCRWLNVKNPCFIISATVFTYVPSGSKLKFGIYLDRPAIEAHAWVEWNDVVLTTDQNIHQLEPIWDIVK